MSAKQTLPEQHLMLQKHWPSECCLCKHEKTIDDLLAALKAAHNARCNRECEGHAPDCSFHDWEPIARAAIARAEGETA